MHHPFPTLRFSDRDGEPRPENLLARDRHAIVDPVEQRRLHEIAAIEMRGAAATGDEPGALGLPDGDVMLDPFALPRQGDRPHVGGGVERHAYRRRPPRAGDGVAEIAVAGAWHGYAPPCRTTLPPHH